jgi:hypothetical protein
MKSHHQLSHDEEVKSFPQYEKWRFQLDDDAIKNITKNTLLKFAQGENMEITDEAGVITFKAVLKPYEKPNKPIPGTTYTLLSTDITKWLVFEQNCTVTIPAGLTTPMLFEGEADPGATVTFQAASGVNLRHVASVSKTLSPNGVFGIRFRDTDNCVLYGTDPVNYLNQ